MKGGNPCPKCGGVSCAQIDKIVTFGREPLSFYNVNFLGKRAKFEAYVCKGCGYTEFHVRNPENFSTQGGSDG